jgi:hypothetical protein
MIISLVGAELFHAGGRAARQTDMTKLIVDISNFATHLKIYSIVMKIILPQIMQINGNKENPSSCNIR